MNTSPTKSVTRLPRVLSSGGLSIRRAAIPIILAAAMLPILPGCADNITWAYESEREGIEYYNKHQYADAAGDFRNAIRQSPREYKAHYYLGACEDALGHYQEALQAYKACLDVMKTSRDGRRDTPFRDRVLSALASDIARSASRDEEIARIQSHARTTQDPEDYILLGRIYRDTGDADSAIDAYNRGALISPKDFGLLKEYGLYLEQLGQNQKAETVLRRAYSRDSQDDQVNAALRRVGVVPGPSVRTEAQ
jgi:tetratricopeptide (TPR) repeat protein